MATPSRNTAAMLLGYARVSRADTQDAAVQLAALTDAGRVRLFEDRASGGRWDRPELHRLLDQLRPVDVVVVWKLDRLSRSLKDLLHLLERIEAAGTGFRSLTERIETTSPAGRMMMQMLGAFAEFERQMIRERTRLGLARARAEGRVGGRRPKLTPRQRAEVVDMVASGRRRRRGYSGCTGRRWAGCWRRSGPAPRPGTEGAEMPIRRELRWLYPIDWPQLSALVRFGRARGRCERCGRPHGRVVHHLSDGRWWDEAAGVWRDGKGREVAWPSYAEYRRLKRTRVVLAAAHLDHDPSNNRPRNVRALCQRCHLNHDRPHHRARARLTVLTRRALGDLFAGPYRR